MYKKIFTAFCFAVCSVVFAQKKIDGVYDSTNKMFIQKNRTFWISELSNGVAKIAKGGYYGIINEVGNVVLPLIYDEIYITNEGIFAKKQTEKFAFNFDGSVNCSTFFGINATRDSYSEYPEYKFLNFESYAKAFSEGFFLIKQEYNPTTNKYQLAFLDSFGNIKITTDKYDRSGGFLNGYAPVSFYKYWGFIDKQGKEVISPKYDNQSFFIEGVSNVSKNNKWGLIDPNEKIIIPFEYDNINPASNGLVAVKKGSKFGFYDLKGNKVLDFIFDDVSSFYNGFSSVKKDGKWVTINKKGEQSDIYQFPFNSGYRFMDYKGNKVYEDKLGYVLFKNTYGIENFTEGLSVVKVNDKFGFIDYLGEIIIKPIYDSAENFKNGYARVRIANNNFTIDKNGSNKIPPLYSKLNFNIKGITFESDNKGTYSMISCNSSKTIEKELNGISIQGNFIIVSKNNKKGLFDFNGTSLLKITYDEIIIKKNKIISKLGSNIEIFNTNLKSEKIINITEGNFSIYDEKKSENGIIIEQNNKKGLINIAEDKMISPRFDTLNFLEKTGLFLGKYSSENYLIDVDKNIATLFPEKNYEEFSKGILKINKYGDNQGLVNSENNIILSPEYKISFLKNNTAIIVKNNLYGIINGKGKIILEPKYQKIVVNDGVYENGDDELILVKQNNKVGFVDRQGNVKIDFQYEDGSPFNNKLAPVKLNGKWGYVDKFNNLVIKNIYDEAWPFFDLYQARVKIGNQFMIIDTTGRKLENLDN